MPHHEFILEVCADSVDSAITAQSAGAQRIEFCNDLPEGGITPSLAQLKAVRKRLAIKVYVLIRPRRGDFLYNDLEFEIMQEDIRTCGKIGCDGVVIGILNADGTVDEDRCRKLVTLAHDHHMEVTFHRAFDRCRNLDESLETVMQLGCERILTSGGKNTAWEGMETIKRLVKKANGKISIMPGAGVTPENAANIIRTTGSYELHGTFRSRYSGGMHYRNTSLGNPEEEYAILCADSKKIQTVLQLCHNLT